MYMLASIFSKLLFASKKWCLACRRVLNKMVILHFSVHVETLLYILRANPGCVVPNVLCCFSGFPHQGI